ncbi:ABC transporter permease [Acetobacterium wieringae]|jgi:D-methionine transport system permease protein|uniref:ABC transporter permease n=1 Tax=Acetobacterium wieringae TaxID=52694 RepID=A0A1F2PGG3_9FIRM|nr:MULTISPECIES: methionine ABC transporter permease [Acetobacterium]MEA4806137.1 methionine ABC transporter permease [Acetobacterium wieringae]OFV70054.1 D-methionine transport system permease protein MetI [Acetobacterium wieringae]TYC87403.1 ABC transporter permease [Acetobacterium wieringae]URN84710.1 ABC transporter permease [Acetobacterium wieringae]UYO63168.1 ABC transporter permease [Acetobacterium wieringae]
MWDSSMTGLIAQGTLETLYMTLASTLLAYLIGLPMGVLLVTSDSEGIVPMKVVNQVLNIVVNITRSIPFLILLIAVIPLTRMITGTTIGSTATIVPLVIAAAPFIARLVESSIKEVDYGIIEASLSMGASPIQVVTKVMIPEAKPSLIIGAAIATTTILGYSAMAGIVGGGGLGDIAIRFGYYRYETGMMVITVVLLVLIVQLFQEVGMKIAQKQDRRK